MRRAAILVAFLLPCIVEATMPPPAWDRVEGKAMEFFRGKGFEFSVDATMSRQYDKPTAEICVVVPEGFMDRGLTNIFNDVTLLNEEVATSVRTFPHQGKKRIILTMSEEMIGKTQLLFYFNNRTPSVTDGSIYVLDMASIMTEWKRSETKKPNQASESSVALAPQIQR